eukprot:scaffold14894_cov74-Phaeocystis_antarctica.AAC.2
MSVCACVCAYTHASYSCVYAPLLIGLRLVAPAKRSRARAMKPTKRTDKSARDRARLKASARFAFGSLPCRIPVTRRAAHTPRPTSMSAFQSNETTLLGPDAGHMTDTADEFQIQCLLIGLAMYFLLAAFIVGAMNGSLTFLSVAELIDLCRPSSTIATR